jgi:hypothetical protein
MSVSSFSQQRIRHLLVSHLKPLNDGMLASLLKKPRTQGNTGHRLGKTCGQIGFAGYRFVDPAFGSDSGRDLVFRFQATASPVIGNPAMLEIAQ